MRRIAAIVILATATAWLAGNVRAQTPGIAMVPLGYCQLATLTSAVLISTCSGGIPASANTAIIQAEAQIVRWRDDGTAPTATVGMTIAAASSILYTGNLSAVRLIEATASAKANISFYRTP